MITYLGELSIGEAVPGAAGACVAGIAGINAVLPDIAARLAALQAFVPITPISFGVQLSIAQQLVPNIQACIDLGLQTPDIGLLVAALQALIDALLSTIAGITAKLDIVVDLQGLLAAAGLHAFAYAGTVGAFGGELSGALSPVGGAGAACNALVLATTSPACWSAMGGVFKVSP